MKTKWLAGVVLLAGTMFLRAQTNDLSAALRQGLFEEEANRNLAAAISNYQALAAQFDKDRQVAATAIFRLGECYRKLGQTNEAVVQYQRVIREFSDQKTLETLSRQNLTGLGTTPQASSPSAIAAESMAKMAQAAGLEAEAAALKTQIEHLSSLKREDRRIAIQQNFSNPVLTTLMQQLNEEEQTLASLTNVYAPTDLHIIRAASLVNAINGQIDTQVDGVINGLQVKMEADLNAAKALRDKSGPVQAAHAEASTVTDDEDQEIRRIQQLIQNSPDLINAPASDGFTPLGNAARNGQVKVATFLLDHGAGINVAQRAGVTALHGATRAGNRAMVELLLSRGADVNSKEVTGQTPLHIAANKGFQAVVEVLLANKAEVNGQDNSGNTPLHLASKGGQVKIIQMLLAAGANPSAENKEGRTPLSFVAESDSPESVRILLAAKADPNGGKLDVPLLAAIHKLDVASAELLLQAGANPNAKEMADWAMSFGGSFHPDGASITPLFLAVSTGQLPMVKLLLKFKADPNDAQTDGRPLLFSALANPDILGALLDAGGKVDSRESRWPLLSSAIWRNNPAIVQTLLQHGADVNVRIGHGCDQGGYTPLHVAASILADRKIAEMLLENKADPNLRGDDGNTPLDLVKQKLAQYLDPQQKAAAGSLADLLRQHGALDNLPHWDRIAVSRPSANYSQTVFQKGTNDWNRFTLLETLLNFYPGKSPGPGIYSQTSLPLPDLTRLTIIRHKQNTTNETHINVDLLNSTNGIDCSRDVPLEFGDVVEIPEREHALGDRPIGLTDYQRDAIINGLKGSVRLEVRGGKVELPVYPADSSADSSLIGYVLNRPEAQSILLSSSDLSRVKVTRHDPVTGKKHEWILDCSRMSSQMNAPLRMAQMIDPYYNVPALRLRDGDVIEVPEKQN
jgi:ankyrin repeat protein